MIDVEPSAVPPPEPERPRPSGPGDWVRHNLFRSTRDGIVTVVSAVVVGYAIYRAVRYVFVTGRWEIVRINLRLFMVGRYPSDELWRISVALASIALFGGVVAGFIGHRRVVTGRAGQIPPVPWWRIVLGAARSAVAAARRGGHPPVDGDDGRAVAHPPRRRSSPRSSAACSARSSPPEPARSSCCSPSSASSASSCSCACRSTSRTGAV